MSPEYALLVQKYGKQSLRAIHAGFNIDDRINALIRKERLIQFPEGTDYIGKSI